MVNSFLAWFDQSCRTQQVYLFFGGRLTMVFSSSLEPGGSSVLILALRFGGRCGVNLVNGRDAAVDGVVRVAGGVEVSVRATDKAETFIEAPFERMELRFIAEARLAEPAGRVARNRMQPGFPAGGEGLGDVGAQDVRIVAVWGHEGTVASGGQLDGRSSRLLGTLPGAAT
jgi:hypothetical protein